MSGLRLLLKREVGILCIQIKGPKSHIQMIQIWPISGQPKELGKSEDLQNDLLGTHLISLQRKMGVSGSSPIDTSMLGQPLCHYVVQMLNQGSLPGALHSQGLFFSWQFWVTYYSGILYSQGAAADLMGTWQKSIENCYPASPVFQRF